MILLDTNVVSELLRLRPDGGVISWFKLQSELDLVTTAITVQESFTGAELLPEASARFRLAAELERTFDMFPVLAYDETCARYTAVLLARSRAIGRPMSSADAQIAGTALRHGATLATRNTKDFEHSAVPLVNPWAADGVP